MQDRVKFRILGGAILLAVVAAMVPLLSARHQVKVQLLNESVKPAPNQAITFSSLIFSKGSKYKYSFGDAERTFNVMTIIHRLQNSLFNVFMVYKLIALN